VDELSRSDLRDVRRAIRERWPVPEEVRRRAIDSAAGMVEHGGDARKLAAIRVLLDADRLNLEQAKLDLAREKLEGKTTEVTLAELVQEAERRAEERERERERAGEIE
jgi:hypothetical protein